MICAQVFEPGARSHDTHTCDLEFPHAGWHHCPLCETSWDKPRPEGGRAGLQRETRQDVFCGCAFIRTGSNWRQVVACPDHVMDMAPQPDPPKPKVKP